MKQKKALKENIKYFKNSALAGVAQWTEHQWTERSPVRFLVRAQAWDAGQIAGWGRARGCTPMFLSLSFSFLSPL